MKIRASVCYSLFVICSFFAPAAWAQNKADYQRTEDVIYGRKFGTALTLDVLQPTKEPNGYGIIFMVSGGWHSSHDAVNHSAGEYGYGNVHTNTIEGFYSIFKRGMKGVYQHCGKQHLSRVTAQPQKSDSDRLAASASCIAEGQRHRESNPGRK